MFEENSVQYQAEYLKVLVERKTSIHNSLKFVSDAAKNDLDTCMRAMQMSSSNWRFISEAVQNEIKDDSELLNQVLLYALHEMKRDGYVSCDMVKYFHKSSKNPSHNVEAFISYQDNLDTVINGLLAAALAHFLCLHVIAPSLAPLAALSAPIAVLLTALVIIAFTASLIALAVLPFACLYNYIQKNRTLNHAIQEFEALLEPAKEETQEQVRLSSSGQGLFATSSKVVNASNDALVNDEERENRASTSSQP